MPFNDPFGGMPPELAGDMRSLKMREAIMQALLQGSLKPPEAPQVKGRFQGSVSPLSMLTGPLGALAAMKGLQGVDKGYGELGEKYRAGVTDALTQYQQTKSGTPADVLPEDVQGPVRPATPGDPRKAVMDAMMSSYPQLRQIGGLDYQQMAADKRQQQQFQNAQALRLSPQWEGSPTAVREYEYAKENGYAGSFEDFKKTVSQQGSQEQYGMSPIWGTDAEGKPVLLQASNRGGVKPVNLPEGVTPQRGQLLKVDTGTEILTTDQNGQIVSRIPKDNRTPAIDKAAGKEIGEREGQLPQLKVKAGTALSELDTKSGLVTEDIDRALEKANTWTTGLIGSATAKVPGTPGHDLWNLLNTIKSNVGFDQLAAMRASSPTGGALGQISDRENTLLQSVMGALEQSQTPEQFKANLTRLKQVIADRKDRMKQAYDQDFGGQAAPAAPAGEPIIVDW